DPGLVGVSAGAGLAAAAAIVLGDKAARFLMANAPFLVPVAAFGGALVTTAMLYRMATWEGRTSIATMLLAGLALGALAGAGPARRGVGARRDRLCRHHRPPPGAACGRAGPSSAAAGISLRRRHPAAPGRHVRAHHRGAGGAADRHRHRAHRRAVLFVSA